MIRLLVLLGFLLAACDGGDTLDADWRADPGIPARAGWTAEDLRTPWSRGLRPPETDAAGESFAWSAGPESQLELDVVDPRRDRLELTGFPYRDPARGPQRVTVFLNDVSLGEAAWEEPGSREVTIPRGLLVRGRNRLRLAYSDPVRPADVEAGQTDTRRLAMAWRRIGLSPGPGPVRLRARWLPFRPGARLHLDAIASGPATVRLLRDPGSGIWSEFAAWDLADGERLEESVVVGHVEDAVGRLGVLTEGEVEWRRLASEVPLPAGARRPDVLLVTLDTTRRDALGIYGAGPEASPHLDAVASRGTVFARAFSPTPATAPTHASMWLSRPPHRHGLTTNGKPLPRAGGDLLPRRLEAWGYQTAGFVSLGVLAADTGFDQASGE